MYLNTYKSVFEQDSWSTISGKADPDVEVKVDAVVDTGVMAAGVIFLKEHQKLTAVFFLIVYL